MSLLGGYGNPSLKKERLYFFILLFATQIFLSSVLVTPVYSRTWYIKPDSTGDAATIQAGIDSAASGDTVLVAPGSYSDERQIVVGGGPKTVNVHLYKNIKLIAEESPNNTIIGNSRSDIAIYVENVDSTAMINGFKIETRSLGYGCLTNVVQDQALIGLGYAIKCDNANPIITNNEIMGNNLAIELVGSYAKIANNNIHDNSNGIRCKESSDAEIINNMVYDCGVLIDCLNSSPDIYNNIIFSNLFPGKSCVGIAGMYSSAHIWGNYIQSMYNLGINFAESDPIIEDNRIENSGQAILLDHCKSSTVVRRNILISHSWAINITDTPSGIIENNTIDGAGVGMVVQRGSNIFIRNNIITRTSSGIECVLFAYPSFECNNIFDVQEFRYAGLCSDQTGINGNISVDPEFCGIDGSGNYYLQSDSPCAPGNHPDGINCGVIGAYDVGCGTTPTAKSTWGAIKSRYVKEEKK